ncbi:hypothetical protein DOT67_13840 [Ralstonia pseudosolanacearum]|uniref:Uncharacterized protein n=4 Tax=Ralstonia solanacearum species complex TaxID=3116862 RepID=A0A454TSR3_9RALS|nr:hypothetical protein RSOE_20450 [Ralstonia solanacearum OE1-1]AXW38826.1 hypothetical protein CJO89_11305 [Ralstonia solanacearum]RAA11382.1 hypothetical protein DOT67_13840 [Ralstonia pseudosolanacearum]RNM07334.1 hypothetical protein EGA29_10455 [Ralstonia pseudosolanacearum]
MCCPVDPLKYIDMSIAKPPVSPARRGILTTRPVSARLMPHELAALEAQALKENRSLSSMVRLMLIKGMEASGLPLIEPSQG